MKPSNVPTGRVTGRFIIGVEDGSDPDDDPDYIAAKGVVELQMSVPYIPNPTADPAPVTMLNARRRMILDAEGYACTPDPTDPTKPGARGMRLEADGSPDALVSGWTWNVTYRFDPVNGSAPSIAAHSFVMLPDAVVDLTTVIKVPSSPGYGLPQSEAAVLRAEGAALESAQSAADAEAAALDVVTRANAGEFKGDRGLPGNATMRVDTTVGTRVFITDGTTERMISGDTGWRNVASLVGADWNADATSCYLTVRRTDSEVFIEGRVAKIGAGANRSQIVLLFTNIPAGFRAKNSFSVASATRVNASTASATPTQSGLAFSSGALSFYTSVPSSTTAWGDGEAITFAFSYATNDAWPTTLPGTPA